MKAGSAWIAVVFGYVGVSTWGELASLLAAVYTLTLIIEWVWKFWKRWKRGTILLVDSDNIPFK